SVNNYLGQQVSVEKFNVASSSVVNRTLDMSALSNGVYFISVATNNGTEVIKVVKQ
ncbi:MAG: T9SS type A sorting domain-containing protein, partial [Bacteroidia bacterium]